MIERHLRNKPIIVDRAGQDAPLGDSRLEVPGQERNLFGRDTKSVWIPVLGGMILIGLLNLAIGYWLWDDAPPPPPPQEYPRAQHEGAQPLYTPWPATPIPGEK